MGFANVRSEKTVMSNNNKTVKLKIYIPMCPTVVSLQQQDSSTFLYTHLMMTRLNSSTLSSDSPTLVYIHLHLSVARLHLSTLI